MLVKPADLAPEELANLDAMFKNDIFPVLTPIAIDPGHPFPHLRSKSLNLGVMFARENELLEPGFGVVQVPAMLSRVMPVKRGGARTAFVLLEDLIARHVHQIFPVLRLRGTYAFRVTRNWDLEIDEEEAEDLLQTIQQELRRRDRGNAVRLEISGEVLPGSLARLCQGAQARCARGRVPRQRAAQLRRSARASWCATSGASCATSLSRRRSCPLCASRTIFSRPFAKRTFSFITRTSRSIRSWSSSPRAADDPRVLAIKQTLYRTSGDSPIIKALRARGGERQAGDGHRRAQGALRRREQHPMGAHARASRRSRRLRPPRAEDARQGGSGGAAREGQAPPLRPPFDGQLPPRDARASTRTSRSLRRATQIGEDVTALFNLLTGYSAPAKWNLLVVAPFGLHEAVLGLIRREAEHARAGRPSGIVAKLNALVDPDVIEALYQAGQAGVPITLLVRGVCGLRPDVPGVSERIQVRALIDRFLEHSRIVCFKNGGQDEVFISSADWMPRNFTAVSR